MFLMQQIENNQVLGFCIIKSVEKKTTRTGNDYLDLTLADADGQVVAKLWDYDEQVHGSYLPEDIIKVQATLTPYRGEDQLRIDQMRKATTSDDGAYKLDQLIPSAPMPSHDMYERMVVRVKAFEDAELKAVLLHFLEAKKEELLYFPAAFALHHAYRGGLLHHMTSMLRLVSGICTVYPYLDEELIIAGVLLHDIAKIEELDVGKTGIASGYTERGLLLGHIPMGVAEVSSVAKELAISDRTTLLLEHMLLSHHGIEEYGSSRQPMFAEAEVVSTIDLLDARLFQMKAALENTDVGSFSAKVWALDNRQLYQHGRSKDTE